jgi:hypothetical protein
MVSWLEVIWLHTAAVRSWLIMLSAPGMPDLTDEKLKVAYFAALMAGLPKHNRALMKYLCQFLAEISAHASKTKMDVNNLSMIFAPSLLGIPDKELDEHGAIAASMKSDTGHLQLVSAAKFLKDAQLCQKILAFLLVHVDEVFQVCAQCLWLRQCCV